MQKICSLAVTLVLFCLLGCHEGPGVCYDSKRFVSFGIFSTSDIDSVQFYLNEQHICIRNTDASQKIVICKEKNPKFSDFMTLMQFENIDLNKCEHSEDNPIWTGFDCLVNEDLDPINVDSSKLSVSIFSNGSKAYFEMDAIIWGGFQVNVIPEQDTIRWFSYKENPAIPSHEALESPAQSIRKGCFGGFCISMFPMDREEICYPN